MRLDKFLAEEYPDTSRAIFQKLIDSKRVEINGAKAKNARQNVDETDDVKVFFPHTLTFADEIAEFARNVIYEDENVVVVNKPAGILTHMKGGLADEFTVSDFVKSRIKTDDDVFSKSNRPGIVHRLDRATSGVLIATKNPETMSFLARQFADRKTHKTYLALVDKAPKLDAARIDLPIGRDPKTPSQFRVDPNGKPAITDYKTLEIFDDDSALVELKPLTGRTHQLRVHLSHINAPIVGDTVYGSGKIGSRMFLHAAELEITIPKIDDRTENQRKIFRADLPDDFQSEIIGRQNR